MEKVKQYWNAFVTLVASHPFVAAIVIVALVVGGVFFMLT